MLIGYPKFDLMATGEPLNIDLYPFLKLDGWILRISDRLRHFGVHLSFGQSEGL